jgi:hypothetical protein
LTALKYFQESAPTCHIACAGSLLGIALSKPYSFPVGKVDFLSMRPLSFREFIVANEGTMLVSYLDFAKHAPSSDFPKVSLIWKSIPDQIAKESGKFVFGHVRKGARAKDLEDALQWLVDAQMACRCANGLSMRKWQTRFPESASLECRCPPMRILDISNCTFAMSDCSGG